MKAGHPEHRPVLLRDDNIEAAGLEKPANPLRAAADLVYLDDRWRSRRQPSSSTPSRASMSELDVDLTRSTESTA
jgi:hypothetical protein